MAKKIATVPVKPKGDPTILLHRNIPKPLHGLAPRTIFGREWWREIRKEIYTRADYHCEACGASRERLEAHEVYDVDYTRARMTFLKVVALCHDCHAFIHDGRLRHLVEEGRLPEAEYRRIMNRGNDLVRHLPRLASGEVCELRWEDWRLVIEGVEYGPSFKSYDEWKSHYSSRKKLK